MTVSIKVRYFASLKESLGRESDTLAFDKAISVAEVWARTSPAQPMPDNTLAAVNMEYVDLGHQVRDDDEVAFFPPVTGG